MKLGKLFSIIFLTLLASFSLPAQANWFKDLFGNKVRKELEVPVTLRNVAEAPVQILDASVKDIGTTITGIKNIEQTYTTEIQNLTGKVILAVQLVWLREIPFEPYLARKFKVNSPHATRANAKQKIVFRQPFDNRSDSYFTVWVKKVLFADNTEWLAEPEEEGSDDGLTVINSLQDLDEEFEKLD